MERKSLLSCSDLKLGFRSRLGKFCSLTASLVEFTGDFAKLSGFPAGFFLCFSTSPVFAPPVVRAWRLTRPDALPAAMQMMLGLVSEDGLACSKARFFMEKKCYQLEDVGSVKSVNYSDLNMDYIW